MTGALDQVRDLAEQARVLAADAFGNTILHGLSDAELVAVIDAAGAGLRSFQALLVEAAGEVRARSESPVRAERLTTRYGAATPVELIARIGRMSGRSAADLVRAGRMLAVPFAQLTGQALPAKYPAMRDALADGVVGVDGVLAVTSILERAATTHTHRLAAEAELALSARGQGADGSGVPADVEELRLQARVWAAYLDPDGAEPDDERASRARELVFGKELPHGGVPIRGVLMPEVAAQLRRLDVAIHNPKLASAGVSFTPTESVVVSHLGAAPTGEVPEFVEGSDPDSLADADTLPPPSDTRTRGQRLHDTLATALGVAARSGELPTIGGGAPTLIVTVREDDLLTGTGVGHIDGHDTPVPLTVVRHVGCYGGIARVTLNKDGRATALETHDRVFTAHQRKVLTVRDGGCVIPGCTVPADQCEIHHVTEHAHGGPTHTDNGVLLCWHHHRTLESSGWRIRMNHGVPEIRGPLWWDHDQHWRPITKSPTHQRQRHLDRLRT